MQMLCTASLLWTSELMLDESHYQALHCVSCLACIHIIQQVALTKLVLVICYATNLISVVYLSFNEMLSHPD